MERIVKAVLLLLYTENLINSHTKGNITENEWNNGVTCTNKKLISKFCVIA